MDDIAVVSASLGGFDKPLTHEPQSIEHDTFNYTDDNFPPRFNSLKPRLQAKIPKCFGWQLSPGYDYYLWLDGNLRLSRRDSLKYLYDHCQGYDVVVLKHPRRDSIHWEYRYNWRGLHNNAPSNYLRGRYANEFLDEQYEVIKSDKSYKDDLMVNGGVFMYRNIPKVQKMLKEWWYHISRYLISDQLSWAYVLKTSGVDVKVLPDVFFDCPWLENKRHKINEKP